MSYISEIATAIRREVDPALVADDDIDGLFRLYAVLALAKGRAVSLEDVHNAWAAWMSGRDFNHPSIEPFSTLSPAVQREDAPFLDAIHTVAERLPRPDQHQLG